MYWKCTVQIWLRRAFLALAIAWVAAAGGTETAIFAPEANLAGADASTTKQLTKLSIEELTSLQVDTVYSASKHTQDTADAPSAVTILTRDDLQKQGYRTLADALNSTPGLYAWNDQNYGLLGIRGFGRPGSFNTKFQVLLDGHRLNDAVTDRVWIDNAFAVDLDMIEKVEVVRGPGSSLYGDSAFSGVVNIVPRRGADLHGVEASASGGSLGAYSGRLSYGNQFTNGLALTLSGTYLETDGYQRRYYPEFATPANNSGYAERVDGERAGTLFTSVTWQDFQLKGGFVQRTKKVPTASYQTVFNDVRNQTRNGQTFADLKFTHEFEGGLELIARLGYDRGAERSTYIYDYGLPASVANIDEFLGERLTGDLQLSRRFWEDHTLTAGAQVVEKLHQNQKNYDVDPAATYLDDRREGLNFAAFLQDEYRIRQNLIFNGGVRYDHFDTFGDTVNPRLALIYHPVAETSLKFLYGTAFRAPSPNELYYSDGGISQVPSPQLQPETVTSYELVAEQQVGRHFLAAGSIFYYRIDDLIGETTLPPGYPNAGAIVLANLGQAAARGVELSGKGRWAGLETRASYSWTDAEDRNTGARLVNSPVHLVKLDVSVPVYRQQLFASAEVQYVGQRLTLTGQTAGEFAVVNFTLFARELCPGLELSASLYNALDTKYYAPGGPEHVQDRLQQNGRQFRIKATYTF